MAVMDDGNGHIPRSLLLQWHISERCDLRCRHCYQEAPPAKVPVSASAPGGELDFTAWMVILDQFKGLLRQWRCDGRRLPGQITVSGGEPFLHPDFMRLLERFAADRSLYQFAILSNGTRINAALAARLAQLQPKFVQISLDGGRQHHDRIRGPGSFDRAVTAIRHLKHHGVRTLIAFTAHGENYRQFSEVARWGWRLGVDRVWADRLVPHGTGRSQGVLTPGQTRAFVQIMAREQNRLYQRLLPRTEISRNRALQFIPNGGRPYGCNAGDGLLALMPNGDLLPCRRMPIPVGNLLETPLAELYENQPLLKKLRDHAHIDPACRDCFYQPWCRGGLKCLSHAVTGDPFGVDPGCWLRGPGP